MKKLLYLEFLILKNSLKLALRSPKRLIPLMLGGVGLLPMIVIWFHISTTMRNVPGHSSPPPPSLHVTTEITAFDGSIAFVLALGIASVLLLQSVHNSFFRFSDADRDFLFPTPILRRYVLIYRLIPVYFGWLKIIPAIAMGFVPILILSGGVKLALIWVVCLAIGLYDVMLVNVCSAVNLLANSGRSSARWVAFMARALALYMLALAGLGFVSLLSGIIGLGNSGEGIHHALEGPIFSSVFPAKFVADLVTSPLSGWKGVYWIELISMMFLVALSFLPLVRRNESLYEISLPTADEPSDKRDVSGKVKPRFSIPPFGRGVWAVVWKNLILDMRAWGSAYAVVVIAPCIFLAVPRVVYGPSADAELIRMMATPVLAIVVTMITPLALVQFRQDVMQVNNIKPIPIPAWQLVAAQGVHLTVLGTLFMWVPAVLIAALYGLPPGDPLLLVALVSPFVCYSSLCAQSAILVIYPHWGDQLQQQIAMLLIMLSLAISVGIPAVVGLVLSLFHVPWVITALAVAIISMLIAGGGILLGAAVYQTQDPTDE